MEGWIFSIGETTQPTIALYLVEFNSYDTTILVLFVGKLKNVSRTTMKKL